MGARERMRPFPRPKMDCRLPSELLGKLPMLMSAIAPMMGGKGEGAVKDSKTALLLALKPYMSPQRCDAIDKLITFARLSDILRQLR